MLELLFSDKSAISYISFSIFTLLGMILYKLWRLNVKKHELNNSGRVLVFSPLYWIKDNSLDFLVAFFSSFLYYRFLIDFTKSVPFFFSVNIGFQDEMANGLILGFFFQYIMHKTINKLNKKQ